MAIHYAINNQLSKKKEEKIRTRWPLQSLWPRLSGVQKMMILFWADSKPFHAFSASLYFKQLFCLLLLFKFIWLSLSLSSPAIYHRHHHHHSFLQKCATTTKITGPTTIATTITAAYAQKPSRNAKPASDVQRHERSDASSLYHTPTPEWQCWSHPFVSIIIIIIISVYVWRCN